MGGWSSVPKEGVGDGERRVEGGKRIEELSTGG